MQKNRLSSRDILAKIWRRTEIHSDFFFIFCFSHSSFALLRLYRLYFILGCVYKMRVTK